LERPWKENTLLREDKYKNTITADEYLLYNIDLSQSRKDYLLEKFNKFKI
jgi:hypothetical protein